MDIVHKHASFGSISFSPYASTQFVLSID